MRKTWFALSLLALLCCVLAGCGDGKTGRVSGVVTMDGQPLPNATVTFEPDGGGRLSSAVTESDGSYSLIYTDEINGAEIGEHRVYISTQRSGDEDQGIESSPETVPAIYNTNTELLRTVERGSNTFNFELESGGEIIEEVGE